MKEDLEAKLKVLRTAKQDFVKASKRAADSLTKERDQLLSKLARVNTRRKRTQEKLVNVRDRLAKSSQDSAKRTRAGLTNQAQNLRQSIASARAEAREMRSELVLVRKNLAEARRHMSHALHIDKAVTRVEKVIAKRKVKTRKAA